MNQAMYTKCMVNILCIVSIKYQGQLYPCSKYKYLLDRKEKVLFRDKFVYPASKWIFHSWGKKKQQSHTKLFYRKVCYYFKWIKTFYSDNLKVLTQRQTLMSPFKIKKINFFNVSFFWLKKKNHHSKLLIFPDILFFFMDQKLSVSWPFYSPLFIF